MKYRLGMLVAAFALMTSAAFAQTQTVVRDTTGVVMQRNAWLRADQGCNSWNVWGNAFGVRQDNHETNIEIFGFEMGVDKNFGDNLKVGATGQYGRADYDGYGDFKTNMWAFGLYGMYKWNNFFFTGSTYYLYNKVNDSSYAWSSTGAIPWNFDEKYYGWSGKFDIGYKFDLLCDFRIMPTIGLDYQWLKYDKKFGFERDTSLEMPLLVTIEKDFAVSFGTLTPFVRGGWIHEFHDKDHNRFGVRKHKNEGLVGAGFNANVNGRADIFLMWDYKWKKHYHSNAVNFGAGVNF